MLFVSALSGVFSSYEFYKYVEIYLGDIIGYSIITNIVFIFLYFRKSFCKQVKMAVIGLSAMNVISIIFAQSGWVYDKIYDLWISLIILVFIIFNTINIKNAIKKIIK